MTQTERPTARDIVRADAIGFGWQVQHTDGGHDVYIRGIDVLIIGWINGGRGCSGWRALINGEFREAHRALCIVQAREVLRGSTDLMAPIPTKENA